MKYYIGIDLGGTNIAAGVVNENNVLVQKGSVKTDAHRSAEEIIKDMAFIAKDVVKKAGIDMNDVMWAGVGAPGLANKSTGVMEYAVNLNWYNVPLAQMLEAELKKPVYIENDANAAAYGEYIAGSAKDANISVMVTLGTGVGGGIVIDNQIYTGFNYAGAELGHTVMVIDGKECGCGRKGCFECYASATGLINITKDHMEKNKDSLMWTLTNGDISKVSGRTSFDAMKKGDPTAQKAVDEYIKYLACGITNIINTFQPDILCIGGGISHEGEYLLKPLRELVMKEVYSRRSEKNTKIVAASLGNEAGIIGAALLGLAK